MGISFAQQNASRWLIPALSLKAPTFYADATLSSVHGACDYFNRNFFKSGIIFEQ